MNAAGGRHAPLDVPVLNGEFEFIAAFTSEAAAAAAPPAAGEQ